MSELEPRDFSGDVPEGICEVCGNGIHYVPTSTDIVYCSHRLRGAYRVLNRPWKVISGIERGHFIAVVVRGLIVGELRLDLAHDLTRLIEVQANSATKH